MVAWLIGLPQAPQNLSVEATGRLQCGQVTNIIFNAFNSSDGTSNMAHITALFQ